MTNGKINFQHKENTALVKEWLKTHNDRLLEKFFANIHDMIKSMVHQSGICQYMEEQEVISLIHIKIWKGLHLFDENRVSKVTGKKCTLYGFITNIIQNRIKQAQIDTAKVMVCDSLDKEDYLDKREEICSEDVDMSGQDDVIDNLLHIKSILTKSNEREAQRWLVNSFIDSGFLIRRHDAANAMSRVYSIDGKRSRVIYDMTLVEIRRQVLGTRKPPKAGPMIGTRQIPLFRIKESMPEEDFDKLIYMMNGISPNIMFCPDEILEGYDIATPLFNGNGNGK